MQGYKSFFIGMVILIAALVLLVVRNDTPIVNGYTNDQFAQMAALLAILVFMIGSFFRHVSLGSLVRGILVWVGLGVILLGVYTYRHDIIRSVEQFAGDRSGSVNEIQNDQPSGFDRGFIPQPIINFGKRLYAELVPSTPMSSGVPGDPVSIRRGRDGQFHVRVLANGQSLSMLIDTGASSIVISHEDAIRVGLDPNSLIYKVPVSTANGRAFVAPAQVQDLRVGTITRTKQKVLVSQQGQLNQSLLGLPFLDSLKSWTVTGDQLTLYP